MDTNASCLHRNDEIWFVISYSCVNEVIPQLLVFLLSMFVHSSGKIIKCTFSCFLTSGTGFMSFVSYVVVMFVHFEITG